MEEDLHDDANKRHSVEGHLGEGAMGEVHLARDINLKRSVALKLIRDEIIDDARIRQSFVREVLITAQLEHPNIVPVYSLDKNAEGDLSYTMKLIKGRTLSDVIEGCPQSIASSKAEEHPLETRLEIFLKVCDALSFSHSRDVIHRDLKPSNIMLGPFGEVYVMDWGIAKLLSHTEDDLEEDGSLIGTLVTFQRAGARRDLAGIVQINICGLILQEIVTPRAAIPHGTQQDLYRRATEGRPLRLSIFHQEDISTRTESDHSEGDQ